MRAKLTFSNLIFVALLFISCGTDNSKKETAITSNKISVKMDSLQPDTVTLKETFNQDDLPVNEQLTERLKPIRANFKRINSITNWTTIKVKDIWETTEGGEAKYYYQNKNLEKITTRNFEETFQNLTEYYLLNGQLSFVFEKSYKYNRPMYYDSASMKENNDTEAFDFKKSEIVETRSYFNNRKLLHQFNNQEPGLPNTGVSLLEEQKRIITDFEKLIKPRTTKQGTNT